MQGEIQAGQLLEKCPLAINLRMVLARSAGKGRGGFEEQSVLQAVITHWLPPPLIMQRREVAEPTSLPGREEAAPVLPPLHQGPQGPSASPVSQPFPRDTGWALRMGKTKAHGKGFTVGQSCYKIN